MQSLGQWFRSRRGVLCSGWGIVVVAYVALYACFLVATDGYPYVLDNNESYSSWWHARSLYENGVSHTKGLTDEVFSHQAAASPYVHTHQGNFPRLFTFLLYAAGFRSIAAQIWISTFTVGLAGIYFAFRFLSGLTNQRYAAIACLVMMTNYLLFAQWQVSLYNVWHVFFFFSSLLCVRALGHQEHRWRWMLLALLNFTAFFYWEYVFTAFVTILCGLYALVLYWRRPGTVLRVWLLVAAGAIVAAAVLLAQLTAYFGWENMKEDVRLTITARNVAAGTALLERVTSFYREHKIIFWHNFMDAGPLRHLDEFVHSLFKFHLQFYTPLIVFISLLVGAGWLLGLMRWPGWIQGRVISDQPSASTTSSALSRLLALLRINLTTLGKWLVLTTVVARMLPSLITQSGGQSSMIALGSIGLWLFSATFTLLLARFWTGSWWGWSRLSWLRLGLCALLAAASEWFLHQQDGLFDPSFQHRWNVTAGFAAGGWLGLVVELGALSVALSCVALGNWQALGRTSHFQLRGLVVFFLCSTLAYAATYRLFTGYIYSGYLHRQVPMLVFVTDLFFSLVLYAMLQPTVRFARSGWPGLVGLTAGARRFVISRSHRERNEFGWQALRRIPAVLPFLTCLTLICFPAAYWVRLQSAYLRVIPPDRYAFLSLLEKAPYKGHSLVTNTYPAPMAARTGSWGYADTSFFSGMVTLTPRGYETEHDLKYLWFADGKTNPAYLKPDLALSLVQTPNVAEALERYCEWQTAATHPSGSANSGLARRALSLPQPFLQHHLLYSDGPRLNIVALDWDFPPFLHPDDEYMLERARQLTLAQKFALSLTGQEIQRRWRIELEPLPASDSDPQPAVELVEFTCDNTPVFTFSSFTAAKWKPSLHTNPSDKAWSTSLHSRSLISIVRGDYLRLRLLRSPNGGRMRVTVNDTTEVIDLKASTLSELTLDWSASQPHGKYTRIPSFSPGLYVRTSLIVQAGQSFADVSYRYAHQESAPETGTVVRLYEENTRSQWRLADTVTFLGASGLPVRLAEFRRQNPETVSEHARSVARGDKRTYEQWLDTHLTMHPEELTRPGILHADVSLSSVDAARVSTRRIPLPAHAGRLQASVMPGTLTKSGPEYFGLPFTPTALLSGRSAKASVEIEPTATASETGPPYGRLKLRLRFPPNRWPQSEPLLTTGVNEAGDILYVIYLDKEHIRIGFDHWFKGGPVTPPIPLDFAREHEVEISLGSLFPPRDDVVFAGVPPASVDELKNRVVVKLDGETVLDAVAECYESPLSEIRVGTNSIRATTTGPLFNGELISMERIWPWPE